MEVELSFRETAKPDMSDVLFLKELNVEKKAIFDWGFDSLWVVKGGDESNEDNLLVIEAEKFHEMTGIQAATSADTVASLLKQGISVEVRNYEGTLNSQSRINRLKTELNTSSKGGAQLSFA